MRRHRAVIVLALSAGISAAESRTASPAALHLQELRPSAADAREAFRLLHTLAGTWRGQGSDAATGAVFAPDMIVEYRPSAGGHVLTETANAGTGEEMLSVFHLDGDRLVLQHYCSAGNQPRMTLVRADSTGLWFDLDPADPGSGFDPATDGHIHSARFIIRAGQPLESLWTWSANGRPDHTARRLVHRMQ